MVFNFIATIKSMQWSNGDTGSPRWLTIVCIGTSWRKDSIRTLFSKIALKNKRRKREKNFFKKIFFCCFYEHKSQGCQGKVGDRLQKRHHPKPGRCEGACCENEKERCRSARKLCDDKWICLALSVFYFVYFPFCDSLVVLFSESCFLLLGLLDISVS